MMNILMILDLTTFEVHAPNIIHLVHKVFVFLETILLINFLIAVMSTSAAITALVMLVEKIILHLDTINVALYLEFRLGWLCEDLIRRCKAKTMLIQDSKC